MYQKIRKLLFHTLVPAVLAAMMVPVTVFAQDYSCSTSIPVEIQVTGSSIPSDVEYRLVLEAVSANAPMPAETQVTITNAGKSEFGPMTYNRPGDYQYRIYQNSDAQNRFTYDDAIYNVTVRVTNAAEGGLTSEIWAVKDGEGSGKADSILFTNSYSRPSSSGDGGGGGSTSPGGGPYNPSGPGVEGDGLTEIDDDATPLAPGFGEGTQIDDDLVPLALPKTGDTTNLALWAALMAISGGCLIFLAVTGKRRNA